MQRIIFFCFLLFVATTVVPNELHAKFLKTESDNRSEDNSKKAEEKQNDDFAKKSEEERLGKLGIAARQMLSEGEAYSATANISGEARFHQTQCPVCDQRFTGIDIERQSIERGMDRDLCKHSINPSAYDFDIWTCPKCGYSQFKHFFSQEVPDIVRSSVHGIVTETFFSLFRVERNISLDKVGFLISQKDIPSQIKYHLAGITLPAFVTPHRLRALYYLQYMYIERHRMSAPIVNQNLSVPVSWFNSQLQKYKELNGIPEEQFAKPETIYAFLEELEQTKEKWSIQDRTLFAIFRAVALDRLGFPSEALSNLRKVEDYKKPDNHAYAVAVFKLDILQHEFYLLKEALMEIREALRANEYPAKEIPSMVYLCGELSRRAGLHTEAYAWLQAAATLFPDDSPLHEWSLEQAALIPQKFRAEKLDETEELFLNIVLRDARIPKQDGEDDSAEMNRRIAKWIRLLYEALAKYRKELEAWPESVEEMAKLGLLDQDPSLKASAPELFGMAKNPESLYNANATPYCISTLNPVSDEQGTFWLAVTETGRILRLKTRPVFKDETHGETSTR